jgi:hypothetical protein
MEKNSVATLILCQAMAIIAGHQFVNTAAHDLQSRRARPCASAPNHALPPLSLATPATRVPVGPCDEGKSKAVVDHGEPARAQREALAVAAQFT